MKIGGLVICVGLAVSAAASTKANAALMFTFDYSGNAPGVGFLDPTTGAARQQALAAAGAQFSNLFGQYFTNTANIAIDARGIDDASNGLLAGAGSLIVGIPGIGTGDVVRNKIITGIDLSGNSPDGFVSINFATPFQLDQNAPVAPGQVDFFSVLDHEFTHALGFQSIFSITDDSTTFTKFDGFLKTTAGVALVDPVTLTVNQAALADARANGARFVGPGANAAFPGGVPIQAEQDLSHLDVNFFTVRDQPRNALMLCCGNPFGADQSEPRDYNVAEIGIMTDLGYTRLTSTDVPEPTSMLLLLTGVGGVIGFARRKHGPANRAC